MFPNKGRSKDGAILGKIFCLMGKSNSGKDTIFKELLKDHNLKLQPLIPYTTRPIRKNESEGLEYHFIDEQILHRYRKDGKIIERRDYNTFNGIWSYCTIDDGQIILDEGNFYLLIATLEAFQSLRKFFGERKVIPLYIDVADEIRLERALYREKQQANPNYEELCRRFLADSRDFSIEKLKACGIGTHFVNNSLEKCIRSIKEYIQGNFDKQNYE